MIFFFTGFKVGLHLWEKETLAWVCDALAGFG